MADQVDDGHVQTVSALAVTPAASDEEAAAIIAAYEALHPPTVAAAPTPPRHSPWRFSARWWARPVAARRDRPWT